MLWLMQLKLGITFIAIFALHPRAQNEIYSAPDPEIASVLIVGAAGFIGSHLTKKLVRLGFFSSVVGIDSFNVEYDPIVKRERAKKIEIHEKLNIQEMNMCDTPRVSKLLRRYRFSHVVVLASQMKDLQHEKSKHYSEEVFDTVKVIPCFASFMQTVADSLPRGSSYENFHIPYYKEERRSGTVVASQPSKLPVVTYILPDRKYANVQASWEASLRDYERIVTELHSSHGLRSVALQLEGSVYGPWSKPDCSVHSLLERILHGAPVSLLKAKQHKENYIFTTDAVNSIIAAIDYHNSAGPFISRQPPKMKNSASPVFGDGLVAKYSAMSSSDLASNYRVNGNKITYDRQPNHAHNVHPRLRDGGAPVLLEITGAPCSRVNATALLRAVEGAVQMRARHVHWISPPQTKTHSSSSHPSLATSSSSNTNTALTIANPPFKYLKILRRSAVVTSVADADVGERVPFTPASSTTTTTTTITGSHGDGKVACPEDTLHHPVLHSSGSDCVLSERQSDPAHTGKGGSNNSNNNNISMPARAGDEEATVRVGPAATTSLEEGLRLYAKWYIRHLSSRMPCASECSGHHRHSSHNYIDAHLSHTTPTTPPSGGSSSGMVNRNSSTIDSDSRLGGGSKQQQDQSGTSMLLCFQSSWDAAAAVSRQLTNDCSLAVYTVATGANVDALHPVGTYQLHGHTPTHLRASSVTSVTSAATSTSTAPSTARSCNVAFVTRQSKLVKALNGGALPASNAVMQYGNWSVVAIDDFVHFSDTRKPTRVPKLSPGRFFAASVHYAVYLDAKLRLNANPADVVRDHMLPSAHNYGKQSVLLFTRYGKQRKGVFDHFNHILQRIADRPSITFYEQALRQQQRAYKEFHHLHHLRFNHMFDGAFIVHDLRSTVARNFRCTWYKEYQDWADRDQVAGAYAIARSAADMHASDDPSLYRSLDLVPIGLESGKSPDKVRGRYRYAPDDVRYVQLLPHTQYHWMYSEKIATLQYFLWNR